MTSNNLSSLRWAFLEGPGLACKSPPWFARLSDKRLCLWLLKEVTFQEGNEMVTSGGQWRSNHLHAIFENFFPLKCFNKLYRVHN
eukprot:09029_3